MTYVDRRLNRIAERIDTAARIKPVVDRQIQHELDECDTQQTNETGITQKGTINDPVINAVVRRGHVIDRSNAIDAAVSDLEAAERALTQALRSVRVPRQTAEHEPRCWYAGCSSLVEHYTDERGIAHYRRSGLCAKHRKQQEREEREEVA